MTTVQRIFDLPIRGKYCLQKPLTDIKGKGCLPNGSRVYATAWMDNLNENDLE